MNFTDIKYKANYYVLLVLAFLIPLERKLIAPLIILFFITSLFNGDFKLKKRKSVLLFSGVYVIYLIGLLYTDNINTGIIDVTTKLSLIIFPISFLLSKINFREIILKVLKSFIDGCFVSAIIAIIISIIKYYYMLDSSAFFYNNIAFFAHPSYLAQMLSLSLIVLYYLLFKQKTDEFQIKTKTILFLLTFFSIYLVLLSSKTGLITMAIIHLMAISFWMIKYKAILKGIAITSLLVIGFILTYKYSPLFQERINEFTTIGQSEKIATSSTSSRKIIWNTSLNLIKKNIIFGYGTGDAKDILVNEYEQKGLNILSEKRLNAHNQYLQTMLAIGLFGGIVLVLMLLIPLYISFKQKHYLYLGFLLLIIINFSTEAMLERQVGVVFYSFFNCLFFVSYFSQNTLKIEE